MPLCCLCGGVGETLAIVALAAVVVRFVRGKKCSCEEHEESGCHDSQ